MLTLRELNRATLARQLLLDRVQLDVPDAVIAPAARLEGFEREDLSPADREFLDFATRMNRGEPDGPSEYHYEYLLVVARKR